MGNNKFARTVKGNGRVVEHSSNTTGYTSRRFESRSVITVASRLIYQLYFYPALVSLHEEERSMH